MGEHNHSRTRSDKFEWRSRCHYCAASHPLSEIWKQIQPDYSGWHWCICATYLFYHNQRQLKSNMIMSRTREGSKVIDIRGTSQRSVSINDEWFSAHGISACDTVPGKFMIGKFKALKIVMTGSHCLNKISVADEQDMETVYTQCTAFIGACYCFPNETDVFQARYKLWPKKFANFKVTKALHRKTLLPMTEAFCEDLHRAYLQVTTWRSVLSNSPVIKPESCGWFPNKNSKLLEPILLPANESLLPESMKWFIWSGCASSSQCSIERCICKLAGLLCSFFWACQADSCCKNWQSAHTNDIEVGGHKEDDAN